MDISSLNNLSYDRAEFQRQENIAEAMRTGLNSADSDAEIMEACKSFEAYFIQTLYRQMRQTTDNFLGSSHNNSLFKKSSAEKLFTDMFDEQAAIIAANNGGMGLAAFMYRQMKHM